MNTNRFSLPLSLLLGVACTGAAMTRAQGPELLSVANLESETGRWISALDMNERGVVVGVGKTPQDATHAFLWRRGQTIDLGALGGTSSEARAINDAGQVVGNYRDEAGRTRAFLWQDGEMIDLNELIDPRRDRWILQSANDINRKGTIVGYGLYTEGQRTYRRGFMLKTAGRIRLVHLAPYTEGGESSASALNDDGQVVGTSGSRGVLWDGEAVINLGSLEGGYTAPAAINNLRQVVGRSQLDHGWDDHAFLWENGKMIDLGTLGGERSGANTILEDGTILGMATDSDGRERAFIWRKGVMEDLNQWVPTWINGDLRRAFASNDSGQLVGHWYIPPTEEEEGGFSGFLATPLCENVRGVELSCFRGDSLQVTVNTQLPAGSLVAIDRSRERRHVAKADDQGRVEFEFPRQSDEQRVCVVDCLDVCAEIKCLPPPDQYLLVGLGVLPGGHRSGASRINRHGDAVGSAGTMFETYHAVLWRDSVLYDMGTLGGDSSFATDINDRGQVVGSSGNGEVGERAFLWEKGYMSDLGTLGGEQSRALGINTVGHVVGWAQNPENGHRAFFWNPGEMIELPTRWGGQSAATDINDAGQVVGYGYLAPEDDRHALLWNGFGEPQDLGTLGIGGSTAEAINQHGDVVGTVDVGGNYYHAFLWTEENGMIDLGSLEGGIVSRGLDINDAGQVVGESTVGPYDWHAFLWEDGVMTDLNDLVPVGCAWDALRVARGINNPGEIVGAATRGDDASEAFLMTPAYCGDVRTLEVSCNRSGQVTARLQTTYRPGTILTLANNQGESQCVIIDFYGRGKARWQDQSGPGEICIEQCRDLCESYDCQ